MDRLESMSIFLSVIEAGSLSAASRLLDIPLASVGRKISDLEAHLKIKLLNRSTRSLTLTDAGQSYFAACKHILEDVDSAERAAAGEYNTPSGRLTLSAPIVFGRLHIVPIVVDFLKDYPDIDIRLALGNRVVSLLEEHIDLGVRVGPLPDSSLLAIRVGITHHVVCASPAYLAAFGTPLVPSDLTHHKCVSFDGYSSLEFWEFPNGGLTETIPIHSRLIVSTVEAAMDAAIAGIGITRVFSHHVAHAQRDRTLTLLLQEYQPVSSPIHLVYPASRQIPLKLRAFLDFAAPRLRLRLAEPNQSH